MKIGIDIHNCIDLYPDVFRVLAERLIADNHEIHIITGQEWEKVYHKVDKYQVPYTHRFSIVDYHKSIGTKMWQDKKGTWWCDEKIWVRSKGNYICREGITVHFDDTLEYANYLPDTCTFVLVPKKGFDVATHIIGRFMPID